MDHTEFSTRVMPMKDKIFRFARSIVSDTAEAEDITQDIFEKLWARRTTLAECTNLDGFVMSSVRNLCYDRLRSRRMRDGKLEAMKREQPQAETPATGFSDTNEIVAALINRLPEKQRVVIHLRDVEGYEFADISEIIGLDVPTVRVTLSRARKCVREELVKIMDYGTR